jgi:arylsulfatase
MPWAGTADIKYPSREYQWELYNIADDYSEADNLVDKNPEKLKELQDMFYVEAKKNNVLPLDASFTERADPAIRPSLTKGRNSFDYYEGAIRIPEGSAPDFKNKSWTVTADVNTAAVSHGVLATMGGYFGGFVLMVKDGKPIFMYRSTNQPQWLVTVQSPQSLSAGAHKISIDFVYDGGGRGKGANLVLSVDGTQVAQKRIERTIGGRFSLDETWDIGEDTGTPVEFKVYDVPFKFTGTLNKVTVAYK